VNSRRTLLIWGGGAKIFGVFRVKNHDLMPKNHIFSNCGGRRENFWGISCEKSQSYAKKIIFSPILGGARAGCAPPPGSAPANKRTLVPQPQPWNRSGTPQNRKSYVLLILVIFHTKYPKNFRASLRSGHFF
jgi:hypothetical protein